MVGNYITDEIQLDLLGSIVPGKVTPHEFRAFWEKFNWENMVEIKTSFTDPKQFVNYIAKELNMEVIGEMGQFAEGTYLIANLYALTSFGYSFLMNFSIEKQDGQLRGHIRLRCEQKVTSLFHFFAYFDWPILTSLDDSDEFGSTYQRNIEWTFQEINWLILIGFSKLSKALLFPYFPPY